MSQRVNRQWRLVKRPEGRARASDFEWREESVPAPQAGEALVRNIYVSLDPANRAWMNDRATYVPPVGLGEVMRGGSLGVIEVSENKALPVGSIVHGPIGWQEFVVTDGKGFDIVRLPKGIPLTGYFGVFGHIGLTAYFGLLDVGQPKEGETLVVSGAAGAVGSLVGQIGKIKGCRVVGIAGDDEKCNWITRELGFDAAINYKTEDVYQSLKKHCPDGIDVYFENVGGEILDAVLALVNLRARIALCGMISQYNATERVPGPYNFLQLLLKRVRLQGFIVFDYLDRAAEALRDLAAWHAAGKLRYRVDVVKGLENAPEALNRLFDGSNRGKLILQVSDEP